MRVPCNHLPPAYLRHPLNLRWLWCHPHLKIVMPSRRLRSVQIVVAGVHHPASLLTHGDLRLHLMWLVVERLDSVDRLLQYGQGYAVVDHLKETPCLRGLSNLVHDLGTVMGRVQVGKIYYRDVDGGEGRGRCGFELGESLGWVYEDTRDGSDARVRETFDAYLGLRELLHFLHSVVIGGCHSLQFGSICLLPTALTRVTTRSLLHFYLTYALLSLQCSLFLNLHNLYLLY